MRRLGWLGGLMVLVAAGCGPPPPADVTGKVRLGGAPLTGGSVTFVGADGKEAYSMIGPQGDYSVRGVAVGKARIAVVGVPHGAGMPSRGAPPGPPPQPAPPRYARPETSGLTVELRSGQQTHPIELEPGSGPCGRPRAPPPHRPRRRPGH